MGVIYDADRCHELRWHDMCTRFHEEWYKRSKAILRFCDSSLLVLLIWRIYDVAVKMASGVVIYVTTTATIWDAVKLVLLVQGFTWHDIHTQIQEDWYTRSSNIVASDDNGENAWRPYRRYGRWAAYKQFNWHGYMLLKLCPRAREFTRACKDESMPNPY
jgi:hypothetical protein